MQKPTYSKIPDDDVESNGEPDYPNGKSRYTAAVLWLKSSQARMTLEIVLILAALISLLVGRPQACHIPGASNLKHLPKCTTALVLQQTT